MISIRRLLGPKNPAEMTYYIQVDGSPIPGTSAAKTLNMVDSQTMALTLGYFVQVQAERMTTFFIFSGAVGGRKLHPHHITLIQVPFLHSVLTQDHTAGTNHT